MHSGEAFCIPSRFVFITVFIYTVPVELMLVLNLKGGNGGTLLFEIEGEPAGRGTDIEDCFFFKFWEFNSWCGRGYVPISLDCVSVIKGERVIPRDWISRFDKLFF